MAAAAPATSAHGAFAFSDLSGFTAFTAERGDDAAIGLVETFRSHMSEGLPPGARIVNRIGDGLLVHFADPSTAVSSLLALTHRCAEVVDARGAPVGPHRGARRHRTGAR